MASSSTPHSSMRSARSPAASSQAPSAEAPKPEHKAKEKKKQKKQQHPSTGTKHSLLGAEQDDTEDEYVDPFSILPPPPGEFGIIPQYDIPPGLLLEFIRRAIQTSEQSETRANKRPNIEKSPEAPVAAASAAPAAVHLSSAAGSEDDCAELASPRICISHVAEYTAFRTAVADCFIKAGDSDYQPRVGFYMLNTWSSAKQVWFMAGVLEKFVEGALGMSAQGHVPLPSVFLRLLAITQTLEGDSHWYQDHEEPEDIDDLMNLLHKLWQAVLQQSDKALQISGPHARQNLLAFLAKFGRDVHNAGDELSGETDLYKFKWTFGDRK